MNKLIKLSKFLSLNISDELRSISKIKIRDEDKEIEITIMLSIIGILALSAFLVVFFMQNIWELNKKLVVFHSLVTLSFYVSIFFIKKINISNKIKIHYASAMVMVEYLLLFFILHDKLTVLYWFILLLIMIPLSTFSFKITIRYMIIVIGITMFFSIFIFPQKDYVKENALALTSFIIFSLNLIVIYFVFIAYKILLSESEKKNKALFNTAYYDYLTKLPNRHYIYKKIKQLISKNKEFYVAYINIIDFKSINDFMSHSIGDEVLINVAKILDDNKEKNDLVARIGGDEFLYIINNLSKDEVENKLKHTIHELNKTIYFNSNNININLYSSVLKYPDDASSFKDVLKNIDISYNKVKKMEKNTILFYKKEMSIEAIKQKNLEDNLLEAIKRNEFYLVYQPIINPVTNEIKYFEALLRWNSQNLGMISPYHFIPTAEKLGIIHELGYLVFNKACKTILKINKSFAKDFSISINVSPLQLKKDSFISEIKESIKQTTIDPKNIIIELTESAFIDNNNISKNSLKIIHELGIKTAIDDFGTGYSSLGYLSYLNVDYLKIDKSFIDGLLLDDKNKKIIETIISLGHTMDMSITAEGVENKEQIQTLKELNCDFIQGYYYSKPLKEEDLINYLSNKNEL